MAQCESIKADGQRCSARAMAGQIYCFNHDPSTAQERQRNASNGGRAGGRARPGVGVGELAAVKDQLGDLIGRVEDGSLDNGKVWAINALLNTKLRVIELERKARETDELEARLAALEAASGDIDT